MLRDEVLILLKRYDTEKGPFRKTAGYIPFVGTFFSQTATIKKVRDIKYVTDNHYWLELFTILNQYQKPEQPKKTTDIVGALWVALMKNTPWQGANGSFFDSLVTLHKSNILTPAIYYKLADQASHAATVSEGFRYLADGSEQMREIEEHEVQKNLLTETNFYLLCLKPTYADRLAMGIRFLNLASIDTQQYVDLLAKHAEHADTLGHGFFVLAKQGKIAQYYEELCHEPSQAFHKARQLCGLESQPSAAATQTTELTEFSTGLASSTQAAASSAQEEEIQIASAQPSIPERALKILKNAGLANETNLSYLRQHPSNAKALANGFCALANEKILTKKNRAILMARPHLAEITALILCKLRSKKALNDKKRLVIVENFDLAVNLASCIDLLEQGFTFNKESAELLLEHIKEIEAVSDVLALLEGNNLLNPMNCALLLELLKTKHIEALIDCLDLLNDKGLLNSCELTHKVFKPEFIEELKNQLTNAYLADSLTDTSLKDLMQTLTNPLPASSSAPAIQVSNLSTAASAQSLANSSHTLWRSPSLQALKGKARPFSVRFTEYLPEKFSADDLIKLRSASFSSMPVQSAPRPFNG